MNILIVGLVNNPQVKRLGEEAQKRDHTLTGCHSSDLVVEVEGNEFRAHVNGEPLETYDLIYLWAMSKRRWEWYTSVKWAHQEHGVAIVNRKVVDGKYDMPLSASPAIDYFKEAQYSLPLPKSTVVFSTKTIPTYIKDYEFPVIVKPALGSKGAGVMMAEDTADLKAKIKVLLKKADGVVVREYIPNDGDIRVFIVDGMSIGAMKRIPPPGDFRANVSLGATAKPFDLEKYPELTILAEKASKSVRVDIAGVDIVVHKETKKPYILEVNPGPQFLGLEKYTETNVALEIIKFFETFQNQKSKQGVNKKK